MGVFSFLREFFVDPIVQYSGYNIVNTLVYAAILIGLAFLVIFPALDRRGVKFNARFMLALMPYIMLGITFRILEDLHILPRSPFPWEVWYYTISPGVWILIGLVTIACLLIARKIANAKKLEFESVFGGIGLGLCLPFLVFDMLQFTELAGFLAILAAASALTAAAYFAAKLFASPLFAEKLGIFALAGQALDGCATVVATSSALGIGYRCGEQHFTSGFLLGVHPLLFPLVKVALALLLIYFVDKETENPNMRGFAKVFIAIAGFAPGLRDLFTVAVGTCL
ncbi:MAG: DUF63 family protein [Candidatus Diapherotrites archaeon]